VPDQPAMPRSTKLVIGTVFGVLVVIAAIAPLTLMLVPDPKPVLVGSVASGPSGAYISTQGSVYRVFPRADQLESFPPDAPMVGSTPVVSVKASRIDPTADYSLYSFDGRGVESTRTLVTATVVELRPMRPLSPGRYIAAIARDDLFGGTDYVYFSVAGTPGASTP
jgi:hypothetical protein